ncbi:hypothetical protein Tco_0090179 [Tanacetum coccineum]
MNFTSTNYPTKEELRGKGIKSPSKLLSPKYLSQSSLAEQNRNPSSPKRVHFVNSIVILNKEDEAKEEGNVKSSTTEYEDHEMTVESEEEFEEETEEEIEEEEEDSPKHFDTFPTMKELRYHEWLLKNPRPPWVKAKIRTGNLNNVKFSCMIGHFDKKQAYLDMESPINVMSRLHYNWIMSKRLGPRRKPSNPGKIYNFMGRVKGLKVFVGNFTYECDFVVLEDTTSVIDHDLGHKTDRIPPFVIESDDNNSKKTQYSDLLDLRLEYKHDENGNVSSVERIPSVTVFILPLPIMRLIPLKLYSHSALRYSYSLGSQDDISSGSAAYPTKHFVSSFVTLTPEHECHDKSGLTQGHFSNETGVFSSTLDDGSLVDDFLESQTIDSAIAQDIYVPHWDSLSTIICRDADFLGLLNMNSDQHREAADVCEIRMRVSELEAATAAKSEEIPEVDYDSLRSEVAGEAKIRAKFRLTWMIGHSLRLVVMKCGQSTEYRAAFGKAISMAINKEFEAYDVGVAADYMAVVKELKNVSFPLLDQLEALKDSPLELLISSLTLEVQRIPDLLVMRFCCLMPWLRRMPVVRRERKVLHRAWRWAVLSLLCLPCLPKIHLLSLQTIIFLSWPLLMVLFPLRNLDDLFDTTMLDKPIDL